MMTDLLYFGQDWDEGDSGKVIEGKFIAEVKDKFPEVVLSDAHDLIKGHRQEIELPDEMEDDYLCWIIAQGWLKCSLNIQLMVMGDHGELRRLFDLARDQYPHCFKDPTEKEND